MHSAKNKKANPIAYVLYKKLVVGEFVNIKPIFNNNNTKNVPMYKGTFSFVKLLFSFVITRNTINATIEANINIYFIMINTNGSLTSIPDVIADGILARNVNGIEIIFEVDERKLSDASFVYLSVPDSLFVAIKMYNYLIISIHYKFSIAVFLP
jgi:hypothetical protein